MYARQLDGFGQERPEPAAEAPTFQSETVAVYPGDKNHLPYATLQEDGFIETTAGKGCYVSAQNQDFYLEEQQKKIEEKFAEAIEIARTSGISLDKLTGLLTLMYQEDT